MKVRSVLLLIISFLMFSACSGKEPGGLQDGAIGLKETGSPFIAFNIWIHCGSQNDPVGKEGLASLTAAFLTDSGTRNNSYEEIRNKLYPMAADYNASVDKEMTNFTGRIYKDNLEAYYSIFKDAVLAPAFDPGDFQRVKTQTMNYLRQTRRFSNDEELSKELLYHEIYLDTPYAHPAEGYVTTVGSITLEDVKSFYRKYYTRDNITVAVGGGFPAGFKRRVRDDFDALPSGEISPVPKPEPAAIDGIHVLLVEKDTNSSPVSFGYPFQLHRGDADFYAMMLFNSSMGEHRNSFARLYQVIRETRGINYGDYCYIEAYPRGYETQVPPVNVSRRSQIFEVWLRPIAATSPGNLHDRTLFTIRTAMREFKKVIDEGMGPERFDETRRFLKDYVVNFGATVSRRLAYRVDDAFYKIPDPGFLDSIRPGLDNLTLDQVNAAINRYIQMQNLWIVVITRDAEGFKKLLLSGEPTTISYPGPQPETVLEEDKLIAVYSIPVREENIKIIDINDVFESPEN
jgi:zinc protease